MKASSIPWAAERASHYFTADLVRQFDVAVHIGRTHALEQLGRAEPAVGEAELPQTYPSGV